MESVQLPVCLEPCGVEFVGEPSTEPVNYHSALFRHRRFPSTAHVLWWPSQSGSKTCIIFIPAGADQFSTGNPGLLAWYTPFLAAIHEKSERRLNILAHAFVGHTPGIEADNTEYSAVSLSAQVEHALEFTDAVKREYDRVVVVGHSVGSWVVTQVLKHRENSVDAAFLLFPTICHMKNTPNGRRLSGLFVPPFPRTIAWFSRLSHAIPDRVVAFLYSDWPFAQRTVLRRLISSPAVVYNCLTMAHEEMKAITTLDEGLLQRNKERLHVYFAEGDGWVGGQKEKVLRALDGEETVKVAHGTADIPHAFCINHGETLARQCSEWLSEGGFL
ncbi:uncharacterized protein PHACADRAFT_180430 [Phanerochaete carnosa HHB-10118-sp]|uniref:AB hydrolase-1 domain-containing protein n=1 Tax=Phanerochaete carnosa (strain HHB-10118-sp) TaxID=650164 RepID=K5WQ17_PHACS|nr:uncharacterized protein PHACADRAFT_180430 [Phanerochaete carnosa HHB-10118-sp]EKM61299.1 hypothetical protein PHACADRAFT_180430 [Phanerochaete carnosa HHB-10118-sp]